MKKYYSFIFAIFLSTTTLAQETSSSWGVSISREHFKGGRCFAAKDFMIGLEYAGITKKIGFRVGIFQSRRSKTFNPFALTPIDVLGSVKLRIQTFDFPLTGQIYIGEKNLKFYLNLGLATTLNIPIIVEEYDSYVQFRDKLVTDLSIRGIIGTGFHYRIVKHIGIDLSINQRIALHSFTDSYFKPADSMGLQIKFNYIF